MSAAILRINDLGKAYRNYGSEWRRMLSWFGIPVQPTEEHWVLRHIDLNIRPGEAVGIVGQNGAGKSTLLKLITGTSRPTEGAIQINGRIAAILELGMGFNPEFTGRQNTYHAAGLMGFRQAEIDRVMPEVEAFAEIGEYFDQPVRTYSSGMQMRVAFAVATAFRPQILIIDEALSVGDTYFQHKSFERIREFQRQGTTLLIVSHDRSAVQSLCGRAILLDKGRMIKDGDPEEVVDYYNALIAEKENQNVQVTRHASGKAQTVSGTGEATVVEIGLFDSSGEPIEFVNVGDPVELRIKVLVKSSIPRLVLGYMIKDRLGQPVFGTNTHHTQQAIERIRDGEYIVFSILFSMNLGPGTYSVATALVSTDTHLINNYEWRDLALIFTVSNLNREQFVGTAWIPPVIQITRS
jgi:lipopolysaccharide transport system ATP-binding protein